MVKETKAGEQSPEKYGDLVQRLEEVVKRLEGGELSLEESLKAFEEGVGLVRRGEKLLNAAEKRIEQLLDEEGEPKAVPLKLSPAPSEPSSGEDDDIPF